MRYEVRHKPEDKRFPWHVILVRADGTEGRVTEWQTRTVAMSCVDTMNRSILRRGGACE